MRLRESSLLITSTIVLKLTVAVSMRSYFYYFSFLKNRVTDHRAGVSSKNIEDFLKGGEELRHMITVLQSHYKNNALEHILQEYKKEWIILTSAKIGNYSYCTVLGIP